MLQSIYIQNYALIDKLNIDFTPGFSVITGETGAGKSIILGAIGLLLGQRADVKAIKNGATKCIVEARFVIASYGMEHFFMENDIEFDPEECILRREVSANGKSRAFINDTPASLAQMKILGEKLIDVHSQHQNLLLNKEGFQLNILDILAQDDNDLSAYQKVYHDYKQICRGLEEFIAQAEKSKQDEDYIRFQLEQLEEAGLKENEQAELEKESETLSHAEDIKAGLYKAEQLINMGKMSKQCMSLGMPLIGHIYPKGESVKAEDRTKWENIAYAVRAGAELGVDIIKTTYTGDPKTMAKVVEACPARVAIQGGDSCHTIEDYMNMTYDAINKAGVGGVVFGRFVWSYPDITSLVKSLGSIIHDGATPKQALEMLHDLESDHAKK